MKILYLGGQTAGMIGLLTLLAKGHRPEVVPFSFDVACLARSLGLHCFLEYGSNVYDGNPDVLISVHSRQIVAGFHLKFLPLGGINLHPCLYGYKGKSPIRRAIEAGETKFSVGAHRMTKKVDEGEVLVEKFIEIPRAGELVYTEAEIYQRLYPIYVEVLSEVLEMIR